MAGFSQGGGVGLTLANWMVDGDPGFDIFAMDIARFGEWASLRYTNAKVRENYSRRFSISYPNEELPAGRPQQTTPLYDIMLNENFAVMGDSWGLETPLWFAPSKEQANDVLSFHRSNDFEYIAAEVKAVRESIGVTEISNFAKYEITGDSAEVFLDHLMTNNMPKLGRIILTPMLNENGKLIGDFTIVKANENRFLVFGSLGATKYHMRWFEKQLPSDGTVNIKRLDMTLQGLSIAGPNARNLLKELVDEDISNSEFPFMSFREMNVNGAPCMINRLSYTGDLGYEIWMAPEYQRTVYYGIKNIGAKFNIKDFGMRALLSMRLEKNFPTWFAELRPIYGPYESGLARFININKGKFIGQAAAKKELLNGPKISRISFIINSDTSDVLGDEPIWAKTNEVYNIIDAPHDYGASRFDAKGTEIGKKSSQKDGEWQVVGWVTSGGYAHSIKASMAQGYIPKALSKITQKGVFEIEILGKRFPCRIKINAPFDPLGQRMKS